MSDQHVILQPRTRGPSEISMRKRLTNATKSWRSQRKTYSTYSTYYTHKNDRVISLQIVQGNDSVRLCSTERARKWTRPTHRGCRYRTDSSKPTSARTVAVLELRSYQLFVSAEYRRCWPLCFLQNIEVNTATSFLVSVENTLDNLEKELDYNFERSNINTRLNRSDCGYQSPRIRGYCSKVKTVAILTMLHWLCAGTSPNEHLANFHM